MAEVTKKIISGNSIKQGSSVADTNKFGVSVNNAGKLNNSAVTDINAILGDKVATTLPSLAFQFYYRVRNSASAPATGFIHVGTDGQGAGLSGVKFSVFPFVPNDSDSLADLESLFDTGGFFFVQSKAKVGVYALFSVSASQASVASSVFTVACTFISGNGVFNDDEVVIVSFDAASSGGGGGGNPFDQELNTTDDVEFNTLLIPNSSSAAYNLKISNGSIRNDNDIPVIVVNNTFGAIASPVDGSTIASWNNYGFQIEFLLDNTSLVNSIEVYDRQLKDTADNIVVKWGDGQLLDQGAFIAMDWFQRKLYSTDGTNLQIDYSTDGTVVIAENCTIVDDGTVTATQFIGDGSGLTGVTAANANYLYDTAGTPLLSANGNSRQLFAPDGTTVVLDWESGVMSDLSGQLSIDWDNRSLYGSDGTTVVVDWTDVDFLLVTSLKPTNGLIDSDDVTSVNVDGRALVGATGSVERINWETGLIKDVAGSANSIQWDSRLLYNATGDTTVNWNAFLLYKTGGSTWTLDWNECWLYSGATKSVDWEDRQLFTSDGTTVVLDWASRVLYDATGEQSIHWDGRELYAADGTSILLDWGSQWLYDTQGENSLNWNSRIFYDMTGSGLINWSCEATNTTSVPYWFDSGHSNRLTGDGSGLSGIVAVNANYLYDTAGTPLLAVDGVNRLTKDSGATTSIDYDNRYLTDSSVQTVFNWETRILYSGTTVAAINLVNRQLLYTDGTTIVFDWAGQDLKDGAAGVVSLNWSNRKLYDSSTTECVNWEERWLRAADGTTTVLSWDDCILNDLDGVNALDWDLRQLLDVSDIQSIAWSDRQLVDNTGSAWTLDWQLCELQDTSNLPSISWDARNLFNTSSETTINWENRTLNRGAGNVISFNWNTGELFDGAGTPLLSLDVQGRKLYKDDGTTLMFNWNDGALYDTSAGLSIDCTSRHLRDSGNNLTLSWQDRQLMATDGTTVVLDWAGFTLIDNATDASVNWDTRLLYSSADGQTVNWEDHRLLSSSGSVVNLDWSGAGIDVPALIVDELTYPGTDDTANKILKTDGSGTIGFGNIITGGTYTPTITNLANLAANTPVQYDWVRNGNFVTVIGIAQITSTATATATGFTMTLPVTTAFTDSGQAFGAAFDPNNLTESFGVMAQASSGEVAFYSGNVDDSGHQINFSFTYLVI